MPPDQREVHTSESLAALCTSLGMTYIRIDAQPDMASRAASLIAHALLATPVCILSLAVPDSLVIGDLTYGRHARVRAQALTVSEAYQTRGSYLALLPMDIMKVHAPLVMQHRDECVSID